MSTFKTAIARDIQKKAVQLMLPLMGYKRYFPRAVAYAPLMFGGVGLGHLYTETIENSIVYYPTSEQDLN